MSQIRRRVFLLGGIGCGAFAAGAEQRESEKIVRLRTPDWDIRMAVEYHDRYSAQDFGFQDAMTGRHFCVSGDGHETSNCLKNFVGSIAIARYEIHARTHNSELLSVRELVRTIDAEGVPDRSPFELTLQPQKGVISDIQAFGYQATSAETTGVAVQFTKQSWRLLRQDLFLGTQVAPFVVVYWKHTLSAIRLLDVTPGDGTSMTEVR